MISTLWTCAQTETTFMGLLTKAVVSKINPGTAIWAVLKSVNSSSSSSSHNLKIPKDNLISYLPVFKENAPVIFLSCIDEDQLSGWRIQIHNANEAIQWFANSDLWGLSGTASGVRWVPIWRPGLPLFTLEQLCIFFAL